MIAPFEWPLNLDSPRQELGGASVRELADIPFDKLPRFYHPPGFQPAKGEVVFDERDGVALAAVPVWALMQCEQRHGSIEVHLLGLEDSLFVAVLRYWCEQPNVLVTVTSTQEQRERAWAASDVASDLGSMSQWCDMMLDGQRGNSIAVGVEARMPMPDDDPLDVVEPGGFRPTPMPGELTAMAEAPLLPLLRLGGLPVLVVNRRVMVSAWRGRLAVSERRGAVDAQAVQLLQDHRLARAQRAAGASTGGAATLPGNLTGG